MKLSFVLVLILFASAELLAQKKVIQRKTQSVDFTEETIDGTSRNPDGAYVVQKRAVDFVPLYKVRDHFDENIKKSLEYLK